MEKRQPTITQLKECPNCEHTRIFRVTDMVFKNNSHKRSEMRIQEDINEICENYARLNRREKEILILCNNCHIGERM